MFCGFQNHISKMRNKKQKKERKNELRASDSCFICCRCEDLVKKGAKITREYLQMIKSMI